MSSPSPAVDLIGLLSVVVPEVRPGPGRTRLLNHMDRLVQDLASDPPSRLPECWWLVRQQVTSTSQMSKDERALWVSLEASLLQRWNPWEADWGWHALSLALSERSPESVRILLELPGAPAPALLSATLVPSPPASSKKPSRPQTDPGTALGQALRLGEPARQALVNVLLEKGVDPNVPVDNEGRVALSAATGADLAKALVTKGARLTTEQEATGWLGLLEVSNKSAVLLAQARFAAWLEAIRTPEGAALRQDLANHWSALVDAAGTFLSYRPRAEEMDVHGMSKQFRALGRALETDCWRPASTEPSLPGAWARGSLLASRVGLSLIPDPSQVTSNVSPLSFANDRQGTWSGQTNDGRPAGVWGLMVALVHCPLNNTQSLSIDLFRPPSAPWSWDELGGALESMPPSPLLWRILRQLESLPLPELTPLVKEWQHRCFKQALQQAKKAESVWHMGSLWNELGGLLGQSAIAWVRSSPQERQASEEAPVQTLLELFALDGWRRPQAQQLLEECVASDWPIDRKSLLEAMANPLAQKNVPAFQKSQWEALRLELSLEAAPAIKRPRM